MAEIAGDILIVCPNDEIYKAGLKKLYVQPHNNVSSFTADGSAHTYTAVTMDATSDLWFEIEGEFQQKGYSSEGSKENGSGVFETSITAFIPKVERTKALRIQQLFDSCRCVVIAEDYNGSGFVHGYSPNLGLDAAMVCTVQEVIEPEVNGRNGYTITFSGMTDELARAAVFTISLNAGGTKAFT